ncbi:hypothetical protein INT47_009536 [Mucor saturninus]|uniref:RBR-type E3 ubiquitin transferase n=1 Tax=Mucor saturninus TaxID=64648 RepID=A0A8H7R6C8_9FUNG|nr:hypothetical protein INT47_009536 [Mucor saturninus]
MTEYSFKRKKEMYECIICLEKSYETDFCSAGTDNCEHFICEDCVHQYFTNALNDNRYTSYDLIQCPSPGCKEYYVSDQVMDLYFSDTEAEKWWTSAIGSKAYIANKVSCPMENCHAVFDVDFDYTKQCTFAECHECHRGFCITCQTIWHPGKHFY